jgi:hypothetical protein
MVVAMRTSKRFERLQLLMRLAVAGHGVCALIDAPVAPVRPTR